MNEARRARSLYEFLSALSDSRRQGSVRYIAAEMLSCLIIAYLANCPSTYQAVAWCKRHLSYLQSLGLALNNGIASYDTHQRMLRNMDTTDFAIAFISWMNELLCCCNLHLAIDGKGLRGGTDKVGGKKTPYMLNIINTQTGLVIGSIPINEKTNEMRAIPDALALIAVAGNTFTIDAIGTYLEIICQILDEDGNFVLLVKKNNPDAYANLVDFFETQRTELKAQQEEGCRSEKRCHYESTGWKMEKNRERYEHRRCEVIRYEEELNNSGIGETVFGCNSVLGKNEYLFRTIGLMTSVRIMKEVDENGIDITPDRETFVKKGSLRCPHPRTGDSESDDIQKFGVVSNLDLTAEEILTLKRDHWKCESAHFVLDVTFREDYNPAKAAKFNMSLLRKLAYNICRLALFHGMVKNRHSSPIEAREIAETAVLMRIFLQDHLPAIYFD